MGRLIHKGDGVLVVGNESGISLEITDFSEVIELRRLLQRGLNTWDTAPKWLFDLSDALDRVREAE